MSTTPEDLRRLRDELPVREPRRIVEVDEDDDGVGRMPVFAGVDETRIPGAHGPEHAVELGSPQLDALVQSEASERVRRDEDRSGSRTFRTFGVRGREVA